MPKDTPYHGWYTTEAVNGFDGMFVLPRYCYYMHTYIIDMISMATNIYYDVSLPDEEESEYNHIYNDFWGMDVDLEFIYDQERIRVLPYLLQYRHDPYMFHQVLSDFIQH